MSKLPLPSTIAFPLTVITVSLVTLTSNLLRAETSPTVAHSADYSFQISQDWRNCQEIGEQYQEVSSFETANFYVNICSKGDRYFYSGEAKEDNRGSIFLPAYPLSYQHGYVASNGNISYLISITPDENTLIVRKNGRQIALEKSFNLSCQQVAYPINLNILTQPSNQSLLLPTIPFQSQVALVSIDPEGEPLINQDRRWTEISNPLAGYIFDGNQLPTASLSNCRADVSIWLNAHKEVSVSWHRS